MISGNVPGTVRASGCSRRLNAASRPGQAAEMPAVAVRRFGLRSAGTATALGVLVLVLAIATLTLKGFDHQLTTSGTWSGIAIVMTYAGVGLVVARRQPHNPIGWLLLVFIALYVLGAGAVSTRCWPTAWATGGCRWRRRLWCSTRCRHLRSRCFLRVILLFPDGRLALRRWRRVLWVYAVLTAYESAVSAAQGSPRLPVTTSTSVPTATSQARVSWAAGWPIRPRGWRSRSWPRSGHRPVVLARRCSAGGVPG